MTDYKTAKDRLGSLSSMEKVALIIAPVSLALAVLTNYVLNY